MATHNLFKGIKRVLATNTAYTATTNNDYLYFVRTATTDLEGDIWFQGVHYGHFGEHDLDAINTALEGFLTGQEETGYTNVKDYIDNAIAQVESNVTTVKRGENSFSGLTITEDSSTAGKLDYTVALTNVAPADELAAEIQDRQDADAAIQAELDAVEAAVGLSSAGTHVQSSGRFTSAATTVEAEIAALDAALQNVADQTIVEGSSTEDYVKLDVATEDGVTTISINDSAITAAIQAMDYTGVTPNGQAIVNVTEADGVITATQGDIAAEHVTIADAGDLFTATNVEDALAEIDAAYKAADEAIVGDASASGNTLGKLEDRIEALDADAKEYHLVKTTTGLPETIKERYSLVDADGNVSGDTVDIPKDSHIVSINYITTSGDPHYQNLEYVYIDASGNTQTVYVDMSQLVLETEFASGVSATGGVVHGVVDPQSEEFLTVGANGFKLSGVQDAIDDAKTAATAYTQSEIQKLDVTGDTAVAGQYVAAIEETDGVVAVKTRANVSEAVLNKYAKGSDASAVAATDTVNEAISKLENQVDAAKAAATTKVEKDANANHITLSSATSVDDGSVTYTIGEDDIASATALTKEISDREAADATIQAELDAVESSLGFTNTGYTNDGTYISGDTVAGDIKLLDTALDAIEGNFTDALARETELRESGDTALDARLDVVEEKYLTGVTVNDCAATVTDHVASVEIHADDIEVGKELTGTTGGMHFDSSATTDNVLQEIVDVLNRSVAGSYTGLTTSDSAITLTDHTNGQNIALKRETATIDTVQDGHIEIKESEAQGHEGELYGAMYWIDEETA